MRTLIDTTDRDYIKFTFNRNNLYLFIVLFLMILPISNIFGYGIPIVYFLTPIGMLLLFCVLFGWIKIPSIVKILVGVWIMIILQILISAFYSTTKNLGYFVFPTDILQYVVRFVFLISFIVYSYKRKIDRDKFIKYFLVILNLTMTVGILQWIPWPGREFFVKLYPFRDGSEQLRHLSRSLELLRVHGFAQHATANGGIASFSIAYAYSVLKYYDKYNRKSVLLIILAIANLIASQARAGMLAAAFALILFYFINIKYEKKLLKPTLYFITILTMLVITVIHLYKEGNPFIVRNVLRWIELFETSAGARATSQPQYFFSLMEGSDYFLGLSKAVINKSAISYGVEVEPVNIFVTYGASGFLLQYLLIAILLIYFLKKISKRTQDKAVLTLCVASFIGLSSYQVFSVAYFFFREIRIGLFPWVLMGVSIGAYERYKLKKLI